MSLPAGEPAQTDDSVFPLPGTCPIHTAAATIIAPEEPTETETSPQSPSYGPGGYGPGYVSPSSGVPSDSPSSSSPASGALTPVSPN